MARIATRDSETLGAGIMARQLRWARWATHGRDTLGAWTARLGARTGLGGERGVWLLIGLSWALVFLADLLLRADVAISVLYVVPIALTLGIAPSVGRVGAAQMILLLTLAATTLNALIGADVGHAAGPRPFSEIDQSALENRIVGTIAQIVTGLVVMRQQRVWALERAMIARLKHALQSSGEFVAVASHELKTPLTGARGYSQLLLRRVRRGQLTGLDSQSAEALRLIDELLGRLHALTDDLLQVSRLDTGRFDIRPGRLDIAETVRDVAQHLARQAPHHDIQVNAAEGIGEAAADARRVEQVLTNLIENAIKYSPDGGRIEVALAETRDGTAHDPHQANAAEAPDMAETPGPRHILISVRDDGIGIPMEERERLFQRFARAANAAEAGISGTGLGLYLCRALVETQGGRIWLARSEIGHGSTFSFTLPAWREPEEAPLASARRQARAPLHHPAPSAGLGARRHSSA